MAGSRFYKAATILQDNQNNAKPMSRETTMKFLNTTLIAAVFVLTGCTTAPHLPSAGAIAFGLMGDTPYSQREVRELDAVIDRMNAEELAFVVHVGDITSGRGPCTDEWFLARKAQFERLRHPFILIPGDNDWTDCHRSGMDPLERLARFRELFEAGDESMGQRPMKLERQSTNPKFAAYREHMRWQAGNVLFVTLNVQGSNNNLGRNATMDREYRERMAAALSWLDTSADLAAREQLAALVVLTQANPDFEERGAERGPSDGFAEFRDELRRHALRLKRPLFLVHGDTHRYRQDRPLKDAHGVTIPNFVRIEVDGSPWVGWLRGALLPAGNIPVHVTPAD